MPFLDHIKLTLGRLYSYQAVFGLEALWSPGHISQPGPSSFMSHARISLCMSLLARDTPTGRLVLAILVRAWATGILKRPGMTLMLEADRSNCVGPHPFPCGLSFSRLRFLGSASLSPLLSLSPSCVLGPAKPRRAKDSNNGLRYFWIPISQPNTMHLPSNPCFVFLLT